MLSLLPLLHMFWSLFLLAFALSVFAFWLFTSTHAVTSQFIISLINRLAMQSISDARALMFWLHVSVHLPSQCSPPTSSSSHVAQASSAGLHIHDLEHIRCSDTKDLVLAFDRIHNHCPAYMSVPVLLSLLPRLHIFWALFMLAFAFPVFAFLVFSSIHVVTSWVTSLISRLTMQGISYALELKTWHHSSRRLNISHAPALQTLAQVATHS